MDKLKGLAGKGWHPEKDGGGIRNKVKGLVGKGDSPANATSSYSSTPYVKKDPANFPPPPRTRRYGEGESAIAPEPRYTAAGRPDLPARNTDDVEEKTYEKGPFIANKTGIDLSKYPQPPGRSDRPVAASPISRIQPKPKPGLPPRLPPRTPSTPDTTGGVNTMSAPSPANGLLNQSALNRLGSSGISVPGLGIGGTGGIKPPALPRRSSGSAPTPPPLPATSASTSAGTTWAEKQAAIKTANQLRASPNTVSLSELRGAASTAKNFQARHGDQVVTGVQTAQQSNQKYGIAGRMEQLSVASGKKPPPPPPAKKSQGGPPPIPVSSKPKPT